MRELLAQRRRRRRRWSLPRFAPEDAGHAGMCHTVPLCQQDEKHVKNKSENPHSSSLDITVFGSRKSGGQVSVRGCNNTCVAQHSSHFDSSLSTSHTCQACGADRLDSLVNSAVEKAPNEVSSLHVCTATPHHKSTARLRIKLRLHLVNRTTILVSVFQFRLRQAQQMYMPACECQKHSK